MKKTYMKPLAYIERFELYEHVASGCADKYKNSGIALFSGKDSCAFIASGLTLFLSSSLNSNDDNPCSDFFDENYDDSFSFEIYHDGDNQITSSMMFSS